MSCFVQDPDAKKPDDWDEREKIDDPEDNKPDDWDKAEHIPDPDAKKPDDWDDEMDGEWEPPMIDNPEYKVHADLVRRMEFEIITSNFKQALFDPLILLRVFGGGVFFQI